MAAPRPTRPRGTLRFAPHGFSVVEIAFVLAVLNHRTRGWAAAGYSFVAVPPGDPARDFDLALTPRAEMRRRFPSHFWGLSVAVRSAPHGAIFLDADNWAAPPPASGHANAWRYRAYVVSHEVGHLLGLGHEACPRPGAPAPVMTQQTLGTGACVPEPWPFKPRGGGNEDADAIGGSTRKG